MGALLLCLGLAIVFTVIAVRFADEYDFREMIGFVSSLLAGLAYLVLLIMVILAIGANFGIKGQIAANQQLYNSLVYQLDNDLYDNDNDVGKKELYEKITNWNTDLARGKIMQHDPWLGIFYPNIYDNFDLIQFPET